MKRETGFTLIELLITMALMGFVVAATSDMFVGLLRGYKQQNKITETNIEGIISLELLRRDIESAGYGLPWTTSAFHTYNEAVSEQGMFYNDSTSEPPRAILSNINTDGSGSAYLVIKAMNLAQNAACTKWALLPPAGVEPWTSSTSTNDNLQANDRVILISPGAKSGAKNMNVRPLRSVIDDGLYSAIQTKFVSYETRIIYGVDSDTDLRMPFNRADYYVNRTTVTIPGRCAPGTGVLVKSIIRQKDGGMSTVPLLDCVADMQVVTFVDASIPLDGKGETLMNGLWYADAENIRERLKEVRVFILAHEGQRDPSFTFAPGVIRVGESAVNGRDFDFELAGITNWQNYRWKIYTLVVRPNSLR